MANENGKWPLPAGWEWTTISDLDAEVNTGFPSGRHNQEGRGVPHLRPMNVSPKGEIDMSLVKYVEESGYDALRAGDVLFNNTNSPPLVGKTSYISKDTDWAYSNHMTRVRFKDGRVFPPFIAYALHTIYYTGFFQRNCRNHVNQASINRTFLSNEVEIPLAPLPEQERIVAEIEKQFTRLDTAVAALKRVQAGLARYKASVLKAAVEGRLVPQDPAAEPAELLLQRILAERRATWEATELEKMAAKGKTPKNDTWKEKYKEPQGPDTADLPQLPVGWVWATAEQICDPIPNGSTPKAHLMQQDNGEVPFIKVYNLTFDGSLNFSIKPTFISRDTHEGRLKRSILKTGDVLMNIVGPPLGKVSIVPNTWSEWNMNQAIVAFRPITDDVSNRYLAYFLLGTSESMQRLYRTAKATAGQFNLNVSTCRSIDVPLPPAAEQLRIVDEIERRISVNDSTAEVVAICLGRAERERQAILQKAFRGELV